MILVIDGEEYPVEWEENESVEVLKELCPLTVKMSMYGGFEQVGSLGESLPRNDEQITTEYGDIVLYSGNQIVVFYGSNTWAYTRLGHIDMTQEELTDLLGNGDVEITLEQGTDKRCRMKYRENRRTGDKIREIGMGLPTSQRLKGQR